MAQLCIWDLWDLICKEVCISSPLNYPDFGKVINTQPFYIYIPNVSALPNSFDTHLKPLQDLESL